MSELLYLFRIIILSIFHGEEHLASENMKAAYCYELIQLELIPENWYYCSYS